ncbi:MAG: glutamate--tRNA ligase [Chloroflexi bacterium]|nr:glutamate--tRNA ligase [Chloroflexota bacterium]
MARNNGVRVRFAPSPTGHLHIGSARTALFNWLFARHNDGDFILRIEDTDKARSTALYEKAIVEQLAWLGLNWDEGPDIGGKYGPYRQSERADIYRAKADELAARGLAYPCFCTPEELEENRQAQLAAGKPPRYAGACRDLTNDQKADLLAGGRKPSLRFRMPEKRVVVVDVLRGEVSFDGAEIGDFIIMRSDGAAGFNFAVVVDDGEMKITHVIRGNDHLPNTARHVPLFEALGYKAPLFAHFGLMMADDGSKLSKRHGSVSVFEYREAGYLAEALDNYLSLVGWSPQGPEVMGLEQLAQAFDLRGVSKGGVAFERAKLDWFNGRHLRALSAERAARLAVPFLEDVGLPVDDFGRVVEAVDAARENAVLLSEVPVYARIFLGPFVVRDDARDELAKAHVPQVLDAFRSLVAGADVLDAKVVEGMLASMREIFKPLGIRGRELFHPVRVGLTGQNVGPDLIRLAVLLGKDEVFQRLSRSLDIANEMLGSTTSEE